MKRPVDTFFQRVEKSEESLKENSAVLLGIIKLLDPHEKQVFFSLLISVVSQHLIKPQPTQLLALGLIEETGKYYEMKARVRERVLEINTKKIEERILVQIESIREQKEDRVYNDALFRTISNKSSGSTIIKRLMALKKMMGHEGVTHKGFNFLLESRKSQMWMLILSHLEETGSSEELLDLCELLTKDPKKIYLIDRKEYKTKILDVFKALGLLEITEGKVQFTTSFPLLFDESIKDERFLSLESNFRLYIYGENQLNIFITSLFTTKIKEFPDMIITSINEESMKKAFDLGITSDQVISYLKEHAIYSLDENVLEQASLWEKRRKRITSWESYLFSNFLNYKDFLLVEAFCEEHFIEYNTYREKRMLIVGLENYEDVKRFIKANIK
ncbi:transcription initiation factor TFIIH subunit 4 [Nematocida sp. LUAm3]|nr:transcription initiation factor TFIIH subunit 4 [Nematocida sp. LUAm3]KAI5174966.1 transcription initiation factor TFIIH subunit 4 [Nematocida sp. LUAm2]KAI5177435.1 transcription initiation factor TFIIH subunit 4 [Nematocida sp. LUAm1]